MSTGYLFHYHPSSLLAVMGDEGEAPTPFTAEQCAWLWETFSPGPSWLTTEDETSSGQRSESSEPLVSQGPSTSGELRFFSLPRREFFMLTESPRPHRLFKMRCVDCARWPALLWSLQLELVSCSLWLTSPSWLSLPSWAIILLYVDTQSGSIIIRTCTPSSFPYYTCSISDVYTFVIWFKLVPSM